MSNPLVMPLLLQSRPREVEAIADRMALRDNHWLGALTRAISAWKYNGCWERCDILYVLGSPDATTSLMNLKNPGTYTLTLGAGSPTFTRYQSIAGDGASVYYATGYDPSTASIGASQDNQHLSSFVAVNDGANTFDVASANGRARIRGRNGNNAQASCGDTTASAWPADGVTPPAHTMISRLVSTDKVQYRNGAPSATVSVASGGITNELKVFWYEAGGTFSSRPLFGFSYGQGFTDDQAKTFGRGWVALAREMGLAPGGLAL